MLVLCKSLALWSQSRKWQKILARQTPSIYCVTVWLTIFSKLGFIELISEWMRILGRDNFLQIMFDRVTSQMENDKFYKRMRMFWIQKLPLVKFITFICNSIASCLCNDAVHSRVKTWCYLLGPDHFVTTFIMKNLDVLEHDTANTQFWFWKDIIRDWFQTWMAGRIGEYLLDDQIHAILLQYFGILKNEYFRS